MDVIVSQENYFSLISGIATANVWILSQNQLRRAGGRGVSVGESLSASVCQKVFERVREHHILRKREGKIEGTDSGPGDRELTNLQGATGLYQCARDQRSNHGASALPGTLCHTGTDPPLGMRRGFLPWPERHGTHSSRGEVSSGVRLEPFFGRRSHLLTWHFSPLRWGKGCFFSRAWNQPWAVRDEQHVHDHLFWPGQMSTEFSVNTPISNTSPILF